MVCFQGIDFIVSSIALSLSLFCKNYNGYCAEVQLTKCNEPNETIDHETAIGYTKR